MKTKQLLMGLALVLWAGQTGLAETREVPAMDIGGLVTMDYGVDIQERNNPALELGEVELAANVTVSPRLTATVALLAEGDLDPATS